MRLDGVLDAVLRSEPMASAVPSEAAAYGYVVWCSRRLAEGASVAQARAAAAIARRHGLTHPLFLGLPRTVRGGHRWAADGAWIAEFLSLGSPSSVAPQAANASNASNASSANASNASNLSSHSSHHSDEDASHVSAAPARMAAAKRRVPAAVRVALWNAWHGRECGVGSCQCCGGEVTQQDFEAGHVVSAARGGSAQLGNLRVLCRTCNRSMGSRDMREFAAQHFGRVIPDAAPAPTSSHRSQTKPSNTSNTSNTSHCSLPGAVVDAMDVDEDDRGRGP